MFSIGWLLALAAASPLWAAGETMSVETFLARASPLQKAGSLVVFKSEFRELMGEIKAVADNYRSELSNQTKAGEAPHSCPPPKVGFSAEEVMAMMRAVPQEERKSTSIKQAFAAEMKKRFPCPAK